ncbi:unnamed protein product [Coregonus sp. 'balchen']|nr:unnamed protein product [Coregonus sp. 'balchen']
MADEDVTLNGKPLQSLRVADLKAALEQRCLPKSGAKNTLIKRLKGALMLENLQRTSTPHIGLQPNSQIGEEMSQNSFIKHPAGPEEEEQTEEGNDSDSYHPDKHRPMPSQPPLTRAEEEGGGGPMMMGHQGQGMMMGQGMMSRRPDFGPSSVPQESPNAPGGPGSWMQHRPSLQHGLHHEEPTTPSPPRAVASLSVRVLGDPERQGLPPSMPSRAQTQEKEGTAPADDDRPAHSVLHLSRSARAAAGGNRVQEDGDDDDSSEEDEDEWGPAAGARRGGGRGCAPPPQPQQPSPSVPAARERSRRKLQPPQHIPPQQVVHQPPMQLRQPTPPPSPPPELSFPLPDTPKQSPPDMDEESEGAGVAVRPPPGGLQRQDSDSSSRSSSPEPLAQRRPGPLSLLARKMASEGAFGKRGEGALADGQTGPGGEASGPGDGVGSSPGAGAGPGVGVVRFPGAAITHTGGSSSAGHTGFVTVPEVPAPVVMFGSGAQPQSHPVPLLSVAAVPSITLTTEPQGPSGETAQKRTEKETKQVEERERKMKQAEKEREKQEEKERESHLPPWQRGRDLTLPSASSQFGFGGSEEPAKDQGDTPKMSPFGRDEPLSSAPGSAMTTTTTPPPAIAPKKLRMFSDTSSGSMISRPKPVQQGSVVVTTPGEPPEPHGISVRPQVVLVSGAQQHTDDTMEGEEERRRKEDEGRRKEYERLKEEERGRRGERARHRRSSPSSGGDSSSSDSGSSSSRTSGSTSSRDKKKKKTGTGKGDKKRRLDRGEKNQPAREVKQSSLSEPSCPLERPDPGQTQPIPVGDPQNSEGRMEESTTPKAFAARKISLTKGGAAAGGEAESGTAAGRKRRWGSSTAVNAKKPSISITTDSLKSLIPDIKPSQEAVVDLHPDDIQLSGDEDTTTTREDQGLDKGLKIRRTVTQVVPGENPENGQGEREEEEEEEEKPERDRGRTQKEKRKNSNSEDTMESQSSTTHDADAKKVIPSDTLVRRSISQQKSGVSVTIDDPVRTAKQPSPPRGKVSNIVHVCNLVRPFTLGQLKELLNRTGSVAEDGFWIDKIKSHCYVTYSSTEEAVATRAALHGVKWPQSNPKVLSVDFCEQNELDFHRGLLTVDPREEHRPQPGVGPGGPKVRPGALPPLMDGRGDRAVVGGVRDQWAEREREMERRERTRAEREWDRDKVRDFGGKPGEERERGRRSRSLDRERRRKERDGKEKKTDKKDEPPAKLLDDLFNKTKAAPCIYWLPLTEEQANQRGKEREERQKERERRRKEQLEEEDKKREEERKERIKSREKEGGAAVSTGSVSVRGSEGDRDRERERGRDREGDKRRDSGGFRPRGPDTKPSSGFRRSRSRSNPRDKRQGNSNIRANPYYLGVQ